MDLHSKYPVIVAVLLVLALAVAVTPQQRQKQDSAYGGLYEEAGSSSITVTTGGSYYQWTSSTIGPVYRGITPSAASDNLTVDAGRAGVYHVSMDISFTSTVNEKIHWHVFLNGSAVDNVAAEAVPAAKTEHNVAATGLVNLAVGDVLDLRVTAVSDGTAVTVTHASLVVVKVD